MPRSVSRRVLLTRRTFLATSASLLATVASQACTGDPGARPDGVPTSTPSGAPTAAEAPVAQVPTAAPTPAVPPAAPPPAAPPPATPPTAPPPAAPPTAPAPTATAAASAPVASAPAAGAPAANAPAVAAAPPALRASVYRGLPDPDDPKTIRPDSVTLANLVREPGQPWRLRGKLVEVVNHGVLVRRSPSGALEGIPMGNAETSSPDGFVFRPSNGGQLPWENEERAGADNDRMREAARFGEVNAYYLADLTLAYANQLLAELGEPPLPFLRVVVNAHFGSRLKGYRHEDGDRDDDKMRPFPGGHYRLPSIAGADGRFRHPVDEMNPTGEIHLGPGREYITDSREKKVVVDGRPYVRNASHVPGIIVHEVGHHINSHTADFLANRLRKKNENSNEKIHMDEGTADYWAAVILETPDIYDWQHAADGRNDRDNRDLRGRRTTDDFDRDGDPHYNGNIWASALWDMRTALTNRVADLLVMKMLVLCGKVGPSATDERSVEKRIEKQIEQKDELRDGLSMLLKADEALYQGKNRSKLKQIFDKRGIDLETPDRRFNRD